MLLSKNESIQSKNSLHVQAELTLMILNRRGGDENMMRNRHSFCSANVGISNSPKGGLYCFLECNYKNNKVILCFQ